MKIIKKMKKILIPTVMLSLTLTITMGVASGKNIDYQIERIYAAEDSNPRSREKKLEMNTSRGKVFSLEKLEKLNEDREFGGKVEEAMKQAEEFRAEEKRLEEERIRKAMEEQRKKDEELRNKLTAEKRVEEERALNAKWLSNISNSSDAGSITSTGSTYYKVNTGKPTNFKSYMGYGAITSVRSMQYKLQHNGKAYTDGEGFRRYDGHYMIAIGTYFNAPAGTYVKVYLDSGKGFTAIVGDIKANKDTDGRNLQHNNDGSVVEFIVETKKMNPKIKSQSSIDSLPQFAGNVIGIEVFR